MSKLTNTMLAFAATAVFACSKKDGVEPNKPLENKMVESGTAFLDKTGSSVVAVVMKGDNVTYQSIVTGFNSDPNQFKINTIDTTGTELVSELEAIHLRKKDGSPVATGATIYRTADNVPIVTVNKIDKIGVYQENAPSFNLKKAQDQIYKDFQAAKTVRLAQVNQIK